MSYVQLELSEWALGIINVQIDRPITSKAQLVEWLREKDVAGEISRRISKTKNEFLSEEIAKDLSAAENEALEQLQIKIQNFLRYLDMTEWVIDTEVKQDRSGEPRKKIIARPLYAKDFSHDLLFSCAEKVLLMSATILDKDVFCRNLGIDLNDAEFIQAPCDFPVENRPIVLEYCGNMGRKYFSRQMNPRNPTEPKFVKKVEEILERHAGQRGIIHCHSFALSKILREQVASPRFTFQDQYGSKEEMLADHASRSDSVIVAPAMHEGLDLRDDLSRWQIIAKVPWPSMEDKVIKERMSRDPAWYSWLTALKTVQSYGRSIRSKTDFATTYILDEGFKMFLQRYGGKMIPGWVREAFTTQIPDKVTR